MKIAVICNPIQDRDGFGDFLYRGFAKICETTHFKVGDEKPGYSHYYYIDDGPTYYAEPKYHPASYFALDFVIPRIWYVNPPEQYLERMRNFDYNYVFTSDVLNYCKKNKLNARLIGFAADPHYHRPKMIEHPYDWTAIWLNYGLRYDATVAAMKRFPNGFVAWRGTGEAWHHEDDLARNVSAAKCSLNIYRANMVNMRVFETMAIGTPLVTQRHKDLRLFGFKEDVHYIGFDEIPEMLDKIQWVLDNPKEAKRIAKNAHRLVMKKHTYLHRAQEILEYN